jgi:hypothetical protein
VNIPIEFLGTLAGLTVQGLGIVWWGSKIDTRVKHLEAELADLKGWRHDQGQLLAERMAVVESKLNDVLARLAPTVGTSR